METRVAMVTEAAQTAEAVAALTQAAPTALPTTGFADEVGMPGLLALAVVFVVVIFLVRRLRASCRPDRRLSRPLRDLLPVIQQRPYHTGCTPFSIYPQYRLCSRWADQQPRAICNQVLNPIDRRNTIHCLTTD